MPSETNLETLRVMIDEIDEILLNDLSKRIEIVRKVWQYKKENNIPFLQSGRWEEVLNSKIEKWKKLWLPVDLVKDVWNIIHEYALEIEKKI